MRKRHPPEELVGEHRILSEGGVVSAKAATGRDPAAHQRSCSASKTTLRPDLPTACHRQPVNCLIQLISGSLCTYLIPTLHLANRFAFCETNGSISHHLPLCLESSAETNAYCVSLPLSWPSPWAPLVTSSGFGQEWQNDVTCGSLQ